MCLAAYDAYGKSNRDGIGFENTVIAAKDAVKEVVKNKMRLFGSSNRA